MTITSTAPTISATGISAPSYADVLAYLQAQYQSIYGSDVYLGNDSQDGQFLGVLAAAINDANSVAIEVYNSFSPATGQGAALSSNVKINGLERDEPSFSSVDLIIGGQAGTTINNGVATDSNSTNRWTLPSLVIIPPSGTTTVTAICQTVGDVLASAGTISRIATPTLGWQTVTNPGAAAPGAPVEMDAQLRQRQTVSTALPSQSILDGIVGAIAAIPGVTRYAPFENSTGVADANGIPAHSISLVVEGGDAPTIAQTIAFKKTPGTGTYGTTNEVITDPYGNTETINFYRPTNTAITVGIALKALNGYSAAIGIAMQNAVAAYINGVAIGGGSAQAVEWDACIAAAKSVANSNTFKISSLVVSGPSGAGTPDVALTFNEAATIDPGSSTVGSTGVVLTVS